MKRTAEAGMLGLLVGLGLVSGAIAEERRGCDKFEWPVDRERAALTSPNLPVANPGEPRLAADSAFRLALLPIAEAGLPKPPERSPGQSPPGQSGSFAGYLRFTAPPKRAIYQVALSDAGWVDVIQGDMYMKPVRFSDATACAGLRKIVRFDLEALPFTLQVSGASGKTIGVIVTKAEGRPE